MCSGSCGSGWPTQLSRRSPRCWQWPGNGHSSGRWARGGGACNLSLTELRRTAGRHKHIRQTFGRLLMDCGNKRCFGKYGGNPQAANRNQHHTSDKMPSCKFPACELQAASRRASTSNVACCSAGCTMVRHGRPARGRYWAPTICSGSCGSGRPPQLSRLSLHCWQRPAGNGHISGRVGKGRRNHNQGSACNAQLGIACALQAASMQATSCQPHK